MVIKNHGLLEFCNHQNLRHPSELIREFLSPPELASPAASCLYGPLRYDLASIFSCHDNQSVEIIRGCSKAHRRPEKEALSAKIWSCWDFDSRLIVVTWVCFLIIVNVKNKSSMTTKCELFCPIASSNRKVLKILHLSWEGGLEKDCTVPIQDFNFVYGQ